MVSAELLHLERHAPLLAPGTAARAALQAESEALDPDPSLSP